MKKTSYKEYFSIPNLLCYLRIALIPIFLIVYIRAETVNDYYIATLIIVISGMTDFLDGQIARRFNMVTEFGKIIDPVADKLTQAALVISLTIRYPLMYIVLIVFIIKEMSMMSTAYWFYRRGIKINGAQIYGKICTTSIYAAMIILVLFPSISSTTASILMIICIIALIYSFISYMLLYRRMYIQLKDKKLGSKIN